jgi:hypothetical protein
MSEFISFFSTCPTCGYPRLQAGYTPRLLRKLLGMDYTIEGYCLSCHVVGPLSAQERALLLTNSIALSSPADERRFSR